MVTSLKSSLVGLLTVVVMLAFSPAARAYTPGLGTGPNYCSQREQGGYNLTVNGQPQQIDDVYACGPRPFLNGGGPAIPTFWPITTWAYGGFQCTEFAERYLYTVTDGDLGLRPTRNPRGYFPSRATSSAKVGPGPIPSGTSPSSYR